jgi:hypothetical protein
MMDGVSRMLSIQNGPQKVTEAKTCASKQLFAPGSESVGLSVVVSVEAFRDTILLTTCLGAQSCQTLLPVVPYEFLTTTTTNLWKYA